MANTSSTERSGLGWVIVAVLFLCVAALMGSSIYGFIMIADIMARAHGWSGTESGSLVSAMWMVAPLALLSAPIVKRFGPWRLIILGLSILAAAFACLSVVSEFWQVYALRVLMGVGKVAIMISVPVVVARWFGRRFGTAISVVWAGGNAGGIFAAPLVEHLNRTAGFQATSLTLATGIAAIAVAAVLASRLPLAGNQAGQDDVTKGADLAAGGGDSSPVSWAVIGAIIISTIGLGIANIAFLAMNPQILASFAIDPGTVALIVGFNAAASTIGALAIGWSTDRFGLGWPTLVMGLIYFGGILLYLLLPAAPHAPVAFLGAAFIGLGAAAAEVLWINLLKREASGARFSMVYGIWYFAIQVGYAVGGIIGGWALERFGGATFILLTGVSFAATLIFSAWRMTRWNMPRRARELAS